MNLFDQLINEALLNQSELSPLRAVVEKEVLHHDILREMSNAGLLSQLTFIGGTCLRTCYGSSRLSEDLDFTGGSDFNRETLSNMAQILVKNLKTKYGLQVAVSEPIKDTGNVDTWMIKVQTRPGRKDLPSQRINIDICAIPSYQQRPMMLLNPYGIEMGTSGLILQVESREEIFADKWIALALRPNRIKFRDIWDIIWLHQQNIKLSVELIKLKIKDHRCNFQTYIDLLNIRQSELKTTSMSAAYCQEMRRFLPSNMVKKSIEQPGYWEFIIELMDIYREQMLNDY